MTKSHLATATLITAMALSAGCGSGSSSGGSSSQQGGYTTTFPATENPISEGGHWTNTVSATWNAPVSTVGGSPGHAVGLNSTGFNDSIAMLTGSFNADQQVTVTVFRSGAPSASGDAEIELHLRMTMVPAAGGNPDQVFTYEIDVLPSAGQIVVARWNGPQGNFTNLPNGSGLIPAINDGDVIDATVTGPSSATVITVKLNGATIVTVTDAAGYATGNPGMGFDAGTQSQGANLGVKSFTATPLP